MQNSENNITFAREKFCDIWENELKPLTEEQWKEVPNFGGGEEAATNEEAYMQAEQTGALCTYTVRKDGVLKGYAIFLLCPEVTRTVGDLVAKNVTLYLSPELRGSGVAINFIQVVEDDLEFDEGVSRIDLQFKPHKVPASLMEALGYVASEVTFSKVVE